MEADSMKSMGTRVNRGSDLPGVPYAPRRLLDARPVRLVGGPMDGHEVVVGASGVALVGGCGGVPDVFGFAAERNGRAGYHLYVGNGQAHASYMGFAGDQAEDLSLEMAA